MAGAVAGSVAQPIISNRVEERLADTLDLGSANQARRSDESKSEARSTSDVDSFANYLNQADITLVTKASEDRTRFDPVAEIGRTSVYGMPADKTVI